MKEWKEDPSLSGYVQSLYEIISSLKPRTIKERNRISVAKQQLNEIRKMSKKLEERVQILEERVKLLEEGSGSNE